MAPPLPYPVDICRALGYPAEHSLRAYIGSTRNSCLLSELRCGLRFLPLLPTPQTDYRFCQGQIERNRRPAFLSAGPFRRGQLLWVWQMCPKPWPQVGWDSGENGGTGWGKVATRGVAKKE